MDNLPKTTEQSKSLVYLVGGLVAVVLVVVFFDKIMKFLNGIGEGLGLKDSKDGARNAKRIDDYVNFSNSQGSKSPWSPAFPFAAKPGTKMLGLTVADAKRLSKDVWDSVGYIYDSPAKASAVIHSLKTQSQVAYLAKAMKENYKVDLLTWMNDKFDVMGQREYLRGIIDYVDALPKYLP